METFNVLLLLIVWQCVFTYAQKPNKIFRKDYTFLESTKSFYKIHTVHRNWADAKKTCEFEGASLLYPEDENEARVVSEFFTKSQSFWAFYVGAVANNESIYKTIDGVPVTEKYHNWAENDPKGGHLQSCVFFQREATLVDGSCKSEEVFICKKALSSLEWNSACNMPKHDAQFTTKFFRSDYTYLDTTDSFYKLHQTKSLDWDAARKKCATEEATLFYPEDKHEVDVIFQFMKQSLVLGWRLFLGASTHFAKGVYETLNGVPVTDLYLKWASGEPSGRHDRDCMVLIDDGTFRDVACDTREYFICKKARHTLDINPIDMVKQDYEYNEASGRCYKFHLKPSSWSDAYATCVAEQSYLAIIDSDVEADVLVNLTARAPKNEVAGNYVTDVVHLGFHNLDDEGWSTTKGVPIALTGYSKWRREAPYGEDTKCGSMTFEGQLNDISCDSESFFICEHEIKGLDQGIEAATN